jgi:hypothetical protein
MITQKWRPWRGLLRTTLGGVILLGPQIAAAQGRSGATLLGSVRRASDGAPIVGASVRLDARSTVSDRAGQFVFGNVAAGEATLVVAREGYASRALSLTVTAADTTRVFIRLAPHAVQLDRVVVTAEETRASRDGGSVSRISRDAIEHVQASSLADILQLVPGQPALNPSLAGPRQSLLRQAPTGISGDPGPGTEAERANALGTSVVLDGVPVSNNANLQTSLTILNSGPNALPPFASTSGRGFDLRQIPADNIERVEVIRGVSSARHGDLTAGAILVTSRAGAQRPEFRVRANPLAVEVSTVAGWGGANTRGLSVDANLVRSQDDARSPLDRFMRGTMQVAWSARPLPTLSSTVRVRLFSVLDEARRDPDDGRYQRATSARDRGARVDWRAQLGALDGRGWSTELVASANLAEQVGTYQELVTRDIFPVSGARRDTIAPGVFGRSEYLTRLRIDGRPLNGYLRFETRGDWSRQGWRHEPLFGLEVRHDANTGNGRQFNPLEPPRQNYSVGDRPDDFSRVRALTQLAPYAEYRARAALNRKPLDVRAGARLDLLNPALGGGATRSAVLAPRLNIEWRPHAHVGLRGGYGVTTKAPTLSQLYPLPRYFDLISYNYYPPTPSERLVMFTTRVVDPRVNGLVPVTARKLEGGIDLALGETRSMVTVFHERTSNAFGTSRLPLGVTTPQFRAIAFPAGRPPELDPVPVRVDSIVVLYDAPRNTRRVTTDGIELTVEAPEWQRARTQFSLGAGWFHTTAIDTDVDIPVEQFIGGSTQPLRVGVYDAGRGSEASRLISSARFVHRAPQLGLAASLLWQTTWVEDDRPIGRTNGVPLGYVDRSGRVTALTPAQALQPAYANLVRAVSPQVARWEHRPPLHLITMRLTKTLPARSQLSVFANNALADRPLYQRTRTAGFERRNPPLFFGVELMSALDVIPFARPVR